MKNKSSLKKNRISPFFLSLPPDRSDKIFYCLHFFCSFLALFAFTYLFSWHPSGRFSSCLLHHRCLLTAQKPKVFAASKQTQNTFELTPVLVCPSIIKMSIVYYEVQANCFIEIVSWNPFNNQSFKSTHLGFTMIVHFLCQRILWLR